MDISPLLQDLDRALVLEGKFRVEPLQGSGCNGELSPDLRNGSTHVLRCLKVWYDLPSEVLLSAISTLDRFLTVLKVEPLKSTC